MQYYLHLLIVRFLHLPQRMLWRQAIIGCEHCRASVMGEHRGEPFTDAAVKRVSAPVQIQQRRIAAQGFRAILLPCWRCAPLKLDLINVIRFSLQAVK